nr:uncharacterized protein LOC107449036 [Parasteatoda tepidariorum]
MLTSTPKRPTVHLTFLDRKCSNTLMMVPAIFGLVSFSLALIASSTGLPHFWLKFAILSGTFFSFLTFAVFLILMIIDGIRTECCCCFLKVLKWCKRFKLLGYEREDLNTYSSYMEKDDIYWKDVV